MNDETLDMSMRKYFEQVGVTSPQAIERRVREHGEDGGRLKVRTVLTIEGRGMEHVVEGEMSWGEPGGGTRGRCRRRMNDFGRMEARMERVWMRMAPHFVGIWRRGGGGVRGGRWLSAAKSGRILDEAPERRIEP